MNEITFEQLPLAVSRLLDEVASLKRLLLERSNDNLPISDKLLTIQEAAELLHLSVPTIYGLVHRLEIPVSKKGKRLYFSKEELTKWVKAGRRKTIDEITSEAETQFKNARKKG